MADGDQGAKTLSKRELEVASAYASGESYKEIARSLGLSPTTVRTHLRTVYTKLGVTSKIELARFLDGDAAPDQALDQSEVTADLALELDDAIRRERSLATVLKIVSDDKGDLDTVIDAVMDHALEICEAEFGVLFEFLDDGRAREMRSRNVEPAFADWFAKEGAFELDPETAIGRMATSRQTVNIPDVRGEDLYQKGSDLRIATVDLGKARSFAAIPILSGDRLIGAFTVYRTRVHPFNDRALELAQVFADQSAIAIENARQFRELQTQLEGSQSNREILELIRTNRDDEQPVFKAIAKNAVELCDAQFCMLWRYDGTDIHHCASHGFTSEFMDEYLVDYPMPPNPAGIVHKVIQAGQTVHLPNAQADPYSDAAVARQHGYDYMLGIPVETDAGMWGIMVLAWPEGLKPEEQQVDLLETYAAQAVIAIQNTRHFRELQSRLEQAAATREILGVLSESRDDGKPVFDVILRNAAKICGSAMARLEMVDEGRETFRCVAAWGEEMRSFKIDEAMPLNLPNDLPTALREGVLRHIPDLSKTELYLAGDPIRARMVEEEGYRTYLIVPLISDGQGIGGIVLSRREVAPFSDSDIALLQSFAAQAVIAIENVRQFRELQTRLQREAATREVLAVINRSRDDEQPVFEALLENATRLCNAPSAGLHLCDEARLNYMTVARRDPPQAAIEMGIPRPLDSPLDAPTSIREMRIIHTPDLADTELYRSGDDVRRYLVDHSGIRTYLSVPLIGSAETIGCITLYRLEVAPFKADEIALVESFAAQAVIAIENVRQFRELQTRLEREAASREILNVISQSRDDESSVFDVILDNTLRLCHSRDAILGTVSEDGSQLTFVAGRGETVEFLDWMRANPVRLDDPHSSFSEIQQTLAPVHIPDVKNTERYRSGSTYRRKAVDEMGLRSMLQVPLVSQGKLIGMMSVARNEVIPFTPDQIALVETFAAQAVIAIENVRQFRELQTRLEREAATREILQAISQSRDDQKPVFDVILEQAARLCHSPQAGLVMADEQRANATYAAYWGTPSKHFEPGVTTWSLDSPIAITTAIREGRVVNIADTQIDERARQEHPDRQEIIEKEEIRSVVAVPLMQGDVAIGCISVYHRAVDPFTDEDVRLLENFAAQAVIAIENVRQFKALESLNAELGERVDQQVGEIERMSRLKRFLPAAVADTVVSQGAEATLKSHRALLGVLFCDIRGFTAFCETAEPEETIEVLQTYHEEMGKLINEHGAGVDHRMGDGIMVLFNDPLPCDDPAGDAVRLAIAMRARMQDLSKQWKRLGFRLGFGVGVSLGYATVGMVGFEGRFDYTASGTAVNLASRLCDEAEDGEILLSPRAGIAVEDTFALESRGELAFKGIREPIEIFSLQG